MKALKHLKTEIKNFIKTYLLNKVKSNPNELYNSGIKLAIDDFGSGYSNWTNVLKLKPNYIIIAIIFMPF
ncbi:MAG: EAL domain-containing protein (putative c-di-GMP-specific phosphodiesterase class I) [Sulfurimonas sp.]|jgi:EAL domain-containing protein (putative c-di-GMP-specific phosphodiesterase class I)